MLWPCIVWDYARLQTMYVDSQPVSREWHDRCSSSVLTNSDASSIVRHQIRSVIQGSDAAADVEVAPAPQSSLGTVQRLVLLLENVSLQGTRVFS